MYQRITICLFLLLALTANAQNINLSGKVSNLAGQPIANAIVTLANQGLKDTTGTDGAYSISNTTAAISPKALIPQLRSIVVEKGYLEFSLPDPSPVRVEMYDVKGQLLKRELLQNASSGFYRFNIDKNYHTKLLIIRTSIGRDEFTFRYLPFKGTYLVKQNSETATSFSGSFAKMAAIDDTIKVTATGYSAKAVVISSYDQQLNITLDTAGNVGRSSGCGKNPTLTSGSRTIQSAGQNRSYIMRIPENYDKDSPLPVDLCFPLEWWYRK